MNVSIKNIDEKAWIDFRKESLKHGLKAGEFFSSLLKTHKEMCNTSNTKKILDGPKIAKDIVTRKDLEESNTIIHKNRSTHL